MFSDISKLLIPEMLIFPKMIFLEKDSGFLLELFGVSWCLQREIILVWGVMVMSARSKNHKNEEFGSFPMMNSNDEIGKLLVHQNEAE